MKEPTRYTALLEAVKGLDAAERSSKLAADRRGSMPPGSTRARVTTANADWARKAEARDIKIDIAERAALDALPGLMLRTDCKH
jgi:hypothetical protein